jgi:hypothetical protein
MIIELDPLTKAPVRLSCVPDDMSVSMAEQVAEDALAAAGQPCLLRCYAIILEDSRPVLLVRIRTTPRVLQ